jgi:hypothetical protein
VEGLRFEGVAPVRRSGLAVAVAAIVAVTALPASSHGSVVRFTDPRDDAFTDVWSTKKAIVHDDPHRVRFQVRGNLGPDWYVFVLVDSRRGPKADYKLWWYEDLGTSGCGGRRLFREEIDVRCDRVIVSTSAEWRVWWSMDRRALDPTKRIRWRIHTHYPGHVDHSEDDRAPDSGWYA